MSLKFFDKLSQNFIELLNDKDDSSKTWGINQQNTFVETFLIKNKGSWLRTPFFLIYNSIFRNNFKKLENFCNDIVVKYPNRIFDADDFTFLKESALVSLLKRDDLQMEEISLGHGIASSKESFSNIISEDHTTEISNWIDRKTTTYSTTNNPYKFELILLGTKDGFAPQTS
ncbi:hypothetical protein Glove_71g101 [Diversispora epigaea]|uniref:BACK domain-containing protein n=1 Tax=Diversispora epigaea TaxID=1348612 RepID=A0A397J9V2_9GLOM|nr:hypothetical protein Glove_71g101 [Diversispora epigaea]